MSNIDCHDNSRFLAALVCRRLLPEVQTTLTQADLPCMRGATGLDTGLLLQQDLQNIVLHISLLHGYAAPIPHYGDRGLNAGVLMASLATVRASNFTAERDAIIERYSARGLLPLGDQDVLNIYGHDHPNHIYKMPCIFNFRPAS